MGGNTARKAAAAHGPAERSRRTERESTGNIRQRDISRHSGSGVDSDRQRE